MKKKKDINGIYKDDPYLFEKISRNAKFENKVVSLDVKFDPIALGRTSTKS